jgi:glyoxylase-like metal-dependent hydrolase (beta-lactamase superfamily II)/rhodanese-related sulfurtransferase
MIIARKYGFAFAITLLVSHLGPYPARAAEALTGDQVLQAVSGQVHDIDTATLKESLAARPETVLIDVRTPLEIELLGGMIDAPRSYNIPRGWLEFRIAERAPDRDTPIVVYCGVNLRSPLAAKSLMDMGYRNVSNYADGFFKWQKAGLPVAAPDDALDTMLFRRPIRVTEGVWSAIGATAPPSYANSGHNNNLSFIVTGDGVVVINAGDNYLLARALHEEIRKITDEPVKYLVLENAQGHAAGGAAYWKEQGAHIIAHADAGAVLAAKGGQIIERIRQRTRDKAMGTRLVLPDETFTDERIIELGGSRIELLHLGPAHSPGDISVWLPQKKLVIAGDIAFHQRLLPIFEYTDTAGWLETWDSFAALGAEIVIPGHGDPTDMAEVTRYTRDYLAYLRGKIGELIENGGSLQDVYKIDQTAYAHLHTYDELATLNASTLFRAMEFE